MIVSKVLGDDLYQRLSTSAIANLSSLLQRLVKGSDEIYFTPYADPENTGEVLEGWDKIFNSKRGEINDILLEIEGEQRLKYGPRSIAVPWKDRRKGVLNSFSKTRSEFEYPDINQILKTRGNLRPLSLENASRFLKSTTNSGLPYLQKKGLVLDMALKNFPLLYSSKFPAVPFTRTQEGGKTRTVWGVDIATILNEMRYYRPLLEYQRKVPWRAALRDADDMDTAITNLVKYARANDLYLVSIDFSTFDDTVGRTLQLMAFDYIKRLYQNNHSDDIDDISERFNTVELITPDGILSGEHGIPSGSAFTNEVGSLVQYLLAASGDHDVNFAQVQGDDGVYASSDPEDLKATFERAGLVVNDDKSDISKDYVIYLQNLYHIDYQKDGKIGGIYPTYRALLRIIYQERFEDFKEFGISGKDYYAIRTLSILENVKNHPLFRDFVKYVMTLEKYSLLPSDQGISSYVRMKDIQDGKDVNFKSSFYDSSSGIKDFESYKLVKEMS